MALVMMVMLMMMLMMMVMMMMTWRDPPSLPFEQCELPSVQLTWEM